MNTLPPVPLLSPPPVAPSPLEAEAELLCWSCLEPEDFSGTVSYKYNLKFISFRLTVSVLYTQTLNYHVTKKKLSGVHRRKSQVNEQKVSRRF